MIRALVATCLAAHAASAEPGHVSAIAEYDLDQKFLKPFVGIDGALHWRDELYVHALVGGGLFGQIDGAEGRFGTARLGLATEHDGLVVGIDAGYELLRPDPYDTPVSGDLAMAYFRIGYAKNIDIVRLAATAMLEAGYGHTREQPIAADPAVTTWRGFAGGGLAVSAGIRF